VHFGTCIQILYSKSSKNISPFLEPASKSDSIVCAKVNFLSKQ
jgi:hypothetical protein